MADATITRIIPSLNKKRGGKRHFNFGIEGTNLGKDTTVEAKLKDYEWEIDDKEPHGSTILLIKLKRKKGGPDTKKEDEAIRQIDEITVTVRNPDQVNADEKTVKMVTYALD
jgi:hypothetical protein